MYWKKGNYVKKVEKCNKEKESNYKSEGNEEKYEKYIIK